MLQKVLRVAGKVQKESLPIQDVLTLALEVSAEYGDDKRCGDKKASSAFLTIAKPGDYPQHPYINLVMNQADEDTSAVKALRKKFDQWKISRRVRSSFISSISIEIIP